MNREQIEVLRECTFDRRPNDLMTIDTKQLRKLCDLALSALQPQGEPVAWVYEKDGEKHVIWHDPTQTEKFHGFQKSRGLIYADAPPADGSAELTALRAEVAELKGGEPYNKYAYKEVHAFYEEWPGGLDEINSSIKQFNRRIEEADRKLADKDRDRQYHMDAINRLASVLALSGTSLEVIQAAIDNMTRMARELSELRAPKKEGGE
jgi:hypothetical protein